MAQQRQQRRPAVSAQYQQTDQDEKSKTIAPYFFRPSSTEILVSRANYVRILDLLTLFSELLKIGVDTTPAGTGAKVMTGIYKGVNSVALPFWKAGLELGNHQNDEENKPVNWKIFFSHLLNVLDAISSLGSFFAWIVGAVENNQKAYEWSGYLLAMAMIAHTLKDAIQTYQSKQTEEHDKTAQETRLKSIEEGMLTLNGNDQHLSQTLSGLQRQVTAVEQKLSNTATPGRK